MITFGGVSLHGPLLVHWLICLHVAWYLLYMSTWLPSTQLCIGLY